MTAAIHPVDCRQRGRALKRSPSSALLAMALLAGELPKGKGRKVEPAPTPTPVEPIRISEHETRQQRRARERKAWKRGAR